MIEGGVFGGAGLRCVGRAWDEQLMCIMAVAKDCRFCSLDDGMMIRRILLHIPCPMVTKGFYGKNRDLRGERGGIEIIIQRYQYHKVTATK